MKLITLILIVFSHFILSQSAAAAEPMGRLFTSPAERSNLDYLRQTKKNEPLKAESPALDAETAPAPIVLQTRLTYKAMLNATMANKVRCG